MLRNLTAGRRHLCTAACPFRQNHLLPVKKTDSNVPQRTVPRSQNQLPAAAAAMWFIIPPTSMYSEARVIFPSSNSKLA